MKLISVNALKVGEELASDIRSSNGNMLLKYGTILSERFIDRLKTAGIYAVYVNDAMFDDVKIKPPLVDETKTRTLTSLELVRKAMVNGRHTNAEIIKILGKELFGELSIAALEPVNMISTFAVDTPLLLHAVNVATITGVIASKMSVRPQLAENYIVAALLHDILLDDLSADNDPKFEHTMKTYAYLKASADFDATCYMSAALHHERFDGKGGPRQIKGRDISEGARIIAVADMFDNVSTGYAGHEALPTYQAVEYITAQTGMALDPEIVSMFSGCFAIYPTGAVVSLNIGVDAVVIAQNKGFPARPIVRVMSDKPAERIEFNMMTNSTMFINKVAL